jgi:RNA polymerase sigma-70 factor (ECF subfamily)
MEAQQDFARFQGDSDGEMLGWLRQVLLNNLANFRRHYRGTKKRQAAREVGLHSGSSSGAREGGLQSETPTPSVEAMMGEQSAVLTNALARLPDDYRRALLLRYQEDRSFEEIGNLMQRSPNAARKLWLRAVERLQKEMDVPP